MLSDAFVNGSVGLSVVGGSAVIAGNFVDDVGVTPTFYCSYHDLKFRSLNDLDLC